MKATIVKTTTQKIKVNNTGGVLQSQTPITLKNQVVEINSIEDLPDVEGINVVNGATLIYNSSNDTYEIRPLQSVDLPSDISLGQIEANGSYGDAGWVLKTGGSNSSVYWDVAKGVTGFTYTEPSNTLTITAEDGTLYTADIGEVANLFNISTDLIDAGSPSSTYDIIIDSGDPFSVSDETVDSGNPVSAANNLFHELLNLTHLAINNLQSSISFNASIPSGSSVTQSITVTGAELGDFAVASFSHDLLGCGISAYVSATNTVVVVITNITGNTVTLSDGILAVRILKQSL